MKHTIIIKKQTFNVWIKSCQCCGKLTTILLGRTGSKCLDCLMKGNYPVKHVPDALMVFTNKKLIFLIRHEKIQEIRIKRCPENSKWERIEGHSGKADPYLSEE